MILAHGIGTRGDLPLSEWMFAYAAGAALVLSFVLLGVLWPRSRLSAGAPSWAPPAAVQAALRGLAVVARVSASAVFLATLVAGLFGDLGPDATVAPVAVYVVFWVGVQFASAVLGDVWRVLSPWDTVVAGAERLGWRAPQGWATTRPSPAVSGGFAVAALVAFTWLELVHPEPSETRLLGVALAVYSALVVAGGLAWGRDWLREGEGFAVLFGLLGAMGVGHRRDDGRVGLRPPFAGLAELRFTPTALGAVLVLLGSTTFDGVTRTTLWTDLLDGRSGWSAVPIATATFLVVIVAVGVAYLLAMGVAASVVHDRTSAIALRFAHSLVPIALAYGVAHYFSLLVFEGQSFRALLSDPLGAGWDLFGTAAGSVDFRVLDPTTIAWVQVIAIVAGHVVGVVVAHDRAVAVYDQRTAARSQYALLAIMVGYTVMGLVLLLGA